jgi:hypothetical protein
MKRLMAMIVAALIFLPVSPFVVGVSLLALNRLSNHS